MSRPGGFQNDDVVRGAGANMAKGIGLIAVAVIIGIILLQIVDDGSGPAAQPTSDKPTTTTKATSTTKPTATTTKATTPAKAPAQVRVEVVNAGAPTGAAKNMSTALKSKGYTNQPNQPTDWAAGKRAGNVVMCKSGFEREAAALAAAVGAGTKTAAFPTSNPPPSSANVDCVVAVGS